MTRRYRNWAFIVPWLAGSLLTGCGATISAQAPIMTVQHRITKFYPIEVFTQRDLILLYAVRQYQAVGPVSVPHSLKIMVSHWAPSVSSQMLPFVPHSQLALDTALVQQLDKRPSDKQVLSSLPGWNLEQRDIPSGNSTYWVPKSGVWPKWQMPAVILKVAHEDAGFPGPLTESNISVDGIKLGMSRADVKRLLGKPTRVISGHRTPYPSWLYLSRGLSISFYATGSPNSISGVTAISLSPESPLQLNSGIRIGSPLSQIVEAYKQIQYVPFGSYAKVFIQGQQEAYLGTRLIRFPSLQMVLNRGVVTNILLSTLEVPPT
ncbi:MAG: hypothetical protein C7B46_00010 [Sulfobacillus benefaciens]|uniref:Uncharacterized protein n=1 Tax=Sulfobacillus benefaciens TaxID=453960 RepID=A0A2T2XLP1_9FIRM|nr:MAG: hypothetical protein C7B46_00010 [Sulfobacillus benefaciens]